VRAAATETSLADATAGLTAAQAQSHELSAALTAALDNGVSAYISTAGSGGAESAETARVDALRAALQQLDQLGKEQTDRKERKIAQLQVRQCSGYVETI